MSDTAAPTTPPPTDPNAAQTTGPPPASSNPPAGPTDQPSSSAPPPPPPSSSVVPPPSSTPDTPTQPPPTSPAPIPSSPSPSPSPSPPPATSSPEPPPPAPTTPPPDSTTSPPPAPPVTSTPVTVITVTPSSTPDDTTITLTTTSLNTDPPSSSPPASSSRSSSSSSSSSSSLAPTQLPATSSSGLSQPAKIAIAIIIPIFAVVVIAFLGIFFWRRYKKRKDSEEMRRKEVEEYGYNPNNDVSGGSGGAVLGAGTVGSHGGDMAESDGSGYRGWGSTAGGRKPSAPLSASAATSNTNPGYNKASYMEGGMASMQPQYTPPAQPELYGSPVASSAAPIIPDVAAIGVAESEDPKIQSPDRHSKSPVLSSPTQRPSTADSSTIGAAMITGPSELDDGLHRGDSVASSRYTNATRRSEGSDRHVITTGNGYMTNYHPVDGNDYYNDVANPYAGEHEYNGPASPPMIQQVGARRNTRIENPADSHYAQMPRQGNSGIAQNF
ncbi:hypothetical protein ABW21_db0200581 [Orbilia brochopaga]|nr:hypothetical protein ABW21_db0200581 [Drechslerella brochopaga]